jgi:hypothetical protein
VHFRDSKSVPLAEKHSEDPERRGDGARSNSSAYSTRGVRDPCVFALFRRGCGVRLFSLSVNSLMAAQSATHQRRALELLAVSGRQGCTEAFLLAHGFTLDLLTDMVRAGLATAQIERARAGGQTRLHITEAGRRALRGKRDAG